MKKLFISLIIISALQSVAQKAILDIRYATVDTIDLKLDLYLPAGVLNPVLVIWIHGGAWRSGSKENPPMDLLKKGYALASIDYRTSATATYPALIHDIKASVRYLRANADKLKYNADKIILWGSSAGGHLAALAGLTNDAEDLEGNLGAYTTISSSVQGIIDFFGPTNLSTIMAQSTPHGVGVRGPALEQLFGKKLELLKNELIAASPITHVSKNDPPLFICHGDQDPQVPINQSIELYGKYKELGLPVQMEFAYGAAHGGKQYSDPQLIDKVDKFIKTMILQ